MGLRMQRKWLDRRVKELRHEVIVDRHFVNERFNDDGGTKRLDTLLDQLLEPLGVITRARRFANGALFDAGRRGVVGGGLALHRSLLVLADPHVVAAHPVGDEQAGQQHHQQH